MNPSQKHRRLIIDVQKCCGCFACSSACPNHEIRFWDEGLERHFSAPERCFEDCDLCQKVCPVGAVHLVDMDGEAPHGERFLWSVPLIRCARCGRLYTTNKIRHVLYEKLSTHLTTAEALMNWLPLCPRCRREDEAHRIRAAARSLLEPKP